MIITSSSYYYEKVFIQRKILTKKLGEHHDLYIQSDTLLLADIFENFRNMCLEMYKLGHEKNYFSLRISMASSFKRNQDKIKSFN